MDRVVRDLRYGARKLRRSPGFSALVVATLAVGIGATTALFSVVRGVLLEPLPYPEPERLVQLWQIGDEGQEMGWSEPNFRDVEERSRTLAALAAYQNTAPVLTGAGEASRVAGATVSERFFDVVGVEPSLGRRILPSEHAEGASVVVVVSDRFWRGPLGGDPGVLGRRLHLDGGAYTVVGVLPPDLGFPADADLWIPRSVGPDPSRTAHNWRAVARLAPGVGVEQARSELDRIAADLLRIHGDDTWMAGATVVPLQEELVGGVRTALLVLLGAAGILLLIACTNVANLLLARTTARGRELAVRRAIGADRANLLRQLLTETFVLTLLGGAAGVLLAYWGLSALLALDPGQLPRTEDVSLDGSALAFALALSVAAAAAIGTLAALRSTSADVGALRARRGGDSGEGGGRIREGLVAAQVALTVVLLVGVGLLGRSFVSLVTLDPGYRTDGAVVVTVSLPTATEPSADRSVLAPTNPEGAALVGRMLDRLRRLPGAEAAGGVSAFPLTGGDANGMFLVLERPDEIEEFDDWRRLAQVPGRTGYAEWRLATAGYFDAMDVPLLRGRAFQRGDAPDGPHVALVSESLAEAQWPGEDPVGRWIQFGNMDGDLRAMRVIGVVGDVRDRSLEAEPRPTIYGNALQRTTGLGGRFDLVVATDGSAAAIAPAARRIAVELTSDAPVGVRPLEEVFGSSLAARRFSLVLLGFFGGAALLVAALGLYGIVSYVATRRTREIGIRRALGASDRSVLALVVRQGLAPAGVGLVLGAAAAYAGTRILQGELYEVGPTDPATFLVVALLVAATALLASWIPARRAAGVDPMITLRNE